MSEETCIISPDGIRALEICQEVEKSLFEKIDAAINDAAIQNLKVLEKEGLQVSPRDADYYRFTAQQMLFVSLCGGDTQTFKGGDPEEGKRLIRNLMFIIEHDFNGRDIETASMIATEMLPLKGV